MVGVRSFLWHFSTYSRRVPKERPDPRRFAAAPWPGFLKAISAGTTALLFIVTYFAARAIPPYGSAHTFGIAVAALPMAIPAIALLFVVTEFEVAHNNLLIKRLLWWTPVDLTGLQRVERYPEGFKGSLRVFGNGGLFSFTGIFWNKKLGRYRLFATDPSRFVAIFLPDRVVVVSPADPEAFIRSFGLPIARSSAVAP